MNTEPKQPKDAFTRQLNRAFDAAVNPFFETNTRRDDRQRYESAWREATHSSLTKAESDCIRRNLAELWARNHPERVAPCARVNHAAGELILIDPRTVEEPKA